MTYNIIIIEPNINHQRRSISIALGEIKQMEDYDVKIDRLLEEPTEDKSGSALVVMHNKYGKEISDIVPVGKTKRGGARPGSGRPVGERNKTICVRITQDAYGKLEGQLNKSKFVSDAIEAFGE